ncbi:OLC1v1027052C1 [Oldenlandia corymbosa var. corymbosa]|uniref:OLC1v1027052C1 n=1 Tax=Oldenlandia corymbosa var. corymbosa TaxID=529605 RepID=A0AAV1C8J3_OLDCO|nr:OLC1v1027052C1 [Oldenlandia corymbosa var. corymbosa]
MKPFFIFVLPFLLLLLLPLKNNLSWMTVLGVLLIGFASYIVNVMWLDPQRLRWKLQRQGIKGPRPSFLFGNVKEMQKIQAATTTKPPNYGEFVAHDYTSTIFPYFEQWRKEYGLVYTYSTGNKQHLYINNPELVKEMNQSVTMQLGKPTYITKRLQPMLGNGILRSNGSFWAQQRKILAPEFFMDKVKGMVGLMLESAEPLLSKWESSIDAQGGKIADIKVDEDLRSLSGDVISRACFGSSYFKGKKIFSKLRTLQKTISNQSVLFGASTFGLFPSKQQKEIQSMEKEIEDSILETIAQRAKECEEEPSTEKDLLQQILEGAINDVGQASSKSFIVDNCKNMYFAGHEATAVAMSWCLMLLALHPDWQNRIREELSQVCPNGVPDADSLSKMKMVPYRT